MRFYMAPHTDSHLALSVEINLKNNARLFDSNMRFVDFGCFALLLVFQPSEGANILRHFHDSIEVTFHSRL